MGSLMSEETNSPVHQLITDMALVKQEMHFLREQMKSIQTIFRWFVLAVLTALGTSIMNFVISGGLNR